jgi:carbamoyltransferase
MHKKQKYYIGLANTFHDPAIALVNSEGQVLFAEASERPLQQKRAFGSAADVRQVVRSILKEYCDPRGEFVVVKPWSRKMQNFMDLMGWIGATNHELIPRRPEQMTKYLVTRDAVFTTLWIQYAGFKQSGGHIADILKTDFRNSQVTFVKVPHHYAHAANACFTSPFEKAACMVIDGQGEWGSMSYFAYEQGRLRPVYQAKGPESLGIVYGICTEFCGFNIEKGEEWKLMGLAPYGQLDPDALAALRELVRVDGLSIRYPPLRKIESWFKRMKAKARTNDMAALQVANLAFTTQFFYVEVMDRLLNNFFQREISDNLVLGGGCALNSSYNGEIVCRTKFKNLHVPSAPADDGNALGSALLAYYQDHPNAIPKAEIHTPFLGSAMSKAAIENLAAFSRLDKLRRLPDTIHRETAQLLADGKLVGWVQGRAEFGPRALGNRSILADPRPADMKDKINSRVKFREEFRPFAPSILEEFGEEYFENYQASPYMERTLKFKESAKNKVPAIVHVNASGRLQSVRREWNPRYYDLIKAFYELTGVPMLLNTSFNIMGKPIIHSVEDAIGLFYTTGLDALVLEDYLIEK